MLSFGFRIFCWYRGFRHRTGSDLLLFLLRYKFYATIIQRTDVSNDLLSDNLE